jgi:hypothetical protein
MASNNPKKTELHFNAKMTPLVVSKLDEAFLQGHTDAEACLMVGISPATFYRYLERNPEYGERKELLKNQPIIKARQTINRAIETNPDIAFKFLERKKKDEFGVRTEVDVTSAGGRIVSFSYLPPVPMEGELINEHNPQTNSEATPSLPETTGQDY